MSALASARRTSEWCLNDVNTEQGSACGEKSSTHREEAGGFQDTRRKKWITKESTECIQTAKSPHVRPRTLLKSKAWCPNTPENQLRFTSSFSLRLPSATRDNYRTNVRVATRLTSRDVHEESEAGTKVTEVQREELGEKDFLRESAGNTTQSEHVPETQNDDDDVCSGETRAERDISSHRSSDGLQCGVAVCRRGHPANPCAQGRTSGCEDVTELQVTTGESVQGQSGVNEPLGQNAEGTLSHTNLIPFTEDPGSKADSDCLIAACSPEAINQTLSQPSLSASPYGNNLKSDLTGSTAAMFTSTLMSVLAPHWSGRLRRHKRGFSDVGSDVVQNPNPSVLIPNEQRQRFPLQQIQTWGQPASDFSNRLSGPAEPSMSTVGWQNESFTDSKKQGLNSGSLRINKREVDQTAEFRNPSDDVQRPALSLQSSDYRRMAQSVDQRKSFTSLRSRPTTSTLLLTSRRLNSRKPIPESFQMEKRLSASVSSLHLPSNSIMRLSQTQLNQVSFRDTAKETPVTNPMLASSEQRSDPHDLKRFSSKWGHMDATRKPSYLITGNFDRTLPATSNPSRERLFSNYGTRLNQSKTLKPVQDHGAVDENVTYNKNIRDSGRSIWISPKENANSRFVFSQIPSKLNSDSMLERQINKTSPTSISLGPRTSEDANRINNIFNSNKLSIIKSTTNPSTVQSVTTGPSVILSPAPLTQVDPNNTQNGFGKPSSSPVSSLKMKTFTESLSFSPQKDPSVEGSSPSHLWSDYLNAKLQSKESNQSSSDLSSHVSPSEFKARGVCIPSIYRYLRETSSPKCTQASPALSSPSPRSSSLKQIQEEDKLSENLWFTFDLSPVESHDLTLKPDSASVLQSVPPDTGIKSLSRLSKSPYSTLISTREAAKSLSSPPVTHQRSTSFSYGCAPVQSKSPKVEKRSYPSVLQDRLSQRKSPMGSSDNHLTAKTLSNHQDNISKSISIIADIPACQTKTLIPDTTRPDQIDTKIKNIPREGLNGIFLSQSDKSNTCATGRLNSKELSMPQGTSLVSEVVQKGGVPEPLLSNGTFQASLSPNSKRSLFSLRSKKDNGLTSTQDKEGLVVKKSEMTGERVTKRVDQVLNRIRLKFSGRSSEDSDTTSRRKTKKEEASNLKACESITTESESEDLTVRQQCTTEYSKAPEITRKLDQRDDLIVRIQTQDGQVLDSKAQEITWNLVQMDELSVRRKTKNEKLLDTSETKRRDHTMKSPNSPNNQPTFMMDSCNSSSSGLGFKHEKQNSLTNTDNHQRLTEEGRLLSSPLSPNWSKPDIMNCYATLPPGKRSRLAPSPVLSPYDCLSEDEQNDNVFFGSVLTKRNATFLGEPENVTQPDNDVNLAGQDSPGVVMSSPYTDLKYGLQRRRSVSVSNVVSGRPSGPGRISTGSRQNSYSDLSSSDGFITKSRHLSSNSPVGSPENDVSYKRPTGLECVDGMPFPWNTETDPTPPCSPPHTRRISPIPSPSSATCWTSPDSLSPRGFLPSRNYKSMLSVSKESDSESSTDDEYYLNSDDNDAEETEL